MHSLTGFLNDKTPVLLTRIQRLLLPLFTHLAFSCHLQAHPLPAPCPARDIAHLLNKISIGNDQPQYQKKEPSPYYACQTSRGEFGLETENKEGAVICRYVSEGGEILDTRDFHPLFEDYNQMIARSEDFLQGNDQLAPGFWGLDSDGLKYSHLDNEHILLPRDAGLWSGSGSESGSRFGSGMNNTVQTTQISTGKKDSEDDTDVLATVGGVFVILTIIGTVFGVLFLEIKFKCLDKLNNCGGSKII